MRDVHVNVELRLQFISFI